MLEALNNDKARMTKDETVAKLNVESTLQRLA
jgi:hypothetical protein